MRFRQNLVNPIKFRILLLSSALGNKLKIEHCVTAACTEFSTSEIEYKNNRNASHHQIQERAGCCTFRISTLN